MPHSAHCSLNESHSVFNSGRLHQWREPGSGGGSEELTASWRSTKWAGREWRPLVSLCAPKKSTPPPPPPPPPFKSSAASHAHHPSPRSAIGLAIGRLARLTVAFRSRRSNCPAAEDTMAHP